MDTLALIRVWHSHDIYKLQPIIKQILVPSEIGTNYLYNMDGLVITYDEQPFWVSLKNSKSIHL